MSLCANRLSWVVGIYHKLTRRDLTHLPHHLSLSLSLSPSLSLHTPSLTCNTAICSKPDKNGCPTFDLSHDNEAEPNALFKLSVTDLQFARVLTKAVAAASHFQLVISSRLLAMIRSKLWRMGKALSRQSASQRLIFDRWKKSNWIIE